MKKMLVLLMAVMLVLLSSCGNSGPATMSEYLKRLQRAGSAEDQLRILHEMTGIYEYDLCDYWSDELEPEIGRGLPENLIPDTERAEAVQSLPDDFRNKKWIVLFDDAGVLRMYGSLYTHLPAEMRAPSLKDTEAVLLLKHTEVSFERDASHLLAGTNPTCVKRFYTFYALDVRSGKVFSIYSTYSVPSLSWKDGKAAKISSISLWERVRRTLPVGGKRLLIEDIGYFCSLEHPSEQLTALFELANDHADAFAGGKEGPEILEFIYSPSENVREIMSPFVPDFNSAVFPDEIPESFRNRKYLCLEIHTDTNGNNSVYWRGGLYARLPESMRAATLEEADAVVIIHVYSVKTPLQGYYYYNATDHTASYFEYGTRDQVCLYDLKDSSLIRTGWPCSDAKLWPRLAETLGLEASAEPAQAAPDTTFDPQAAYEAGDTLFYGSYEQDGNPDNGAEPIEWIVLGKEDGRLLLLSQFGLKVMPFIGGDSDAWKSGTWESSDVRAWLNGTFFNEAFGIREREKILKPEGGDPVFLLTPTDVHRYLPSRFARACAVTPFADQQARYSSNGAWWLSAIKHTGYAMGVDKDGNIHSSQMGTYRHAVRPAIWLSMGN